MSLLSRFFYKRPPDGLLEFADRVYVFDSCFCTEVLPDGLYQIYLHEIINDLHEEFPESSFLAFNFREGEKRSLFAEILCEYDVTVLEYPRQYEGCPLLPLSMIQHFLRVCESWLARGNRHDVILLHCERGGWPLLAFILASFLIFRKFHSGERRTLEIVHREAPKGLLQLLSPLNPFPSQLRYLQYVARRNIAPEWPPPERALSLDCVILRAVPNFDSRQGCRPVIRIFGRNFQSKSGLCTEMLYSMSKKRKSLRHYQQAECDVIKIDIQCWVQGDVVLECVHLDLDPEREVMMFRVMFNTAFIRSNILMLNSDNLDILWEAKDRYPKGFRAEVLFGDAENVSPQKALTPIVNGDETGGLPIEAFSKVQELFSGVDWADNNDDATLWLLKQLSVLSDAKEFTRLRHKGSFYLNSPADSEEETNTSSAADSSDEGSDVIQKHLIPISFETDEPHDMNFSPESPEETHELSIHQQQEALDKDNVLTLESSTRLPSITLITAPIPPPPPPPLQNSITSGGPLVSASSAMPRPPQPPPPPPSNSSSGVSTLVPPPPPPPLPSSSINGAPPPRPPPPPPPPSSFSSRDSMTTSHQPMNITAPPPPTPSHSINKSPAPPPPPPPPPLSSASTNRAPPPPPPPTPLSFSSGQPPTPPFSGSGGNNHQAQPPPPPPPPPLLSGRSSPATGGAPPPPPPPPPLPSGSHSGHARVGPRSVPPAPPPPPPPRANLSGAAKPPPPPPPPPPPLSSASHSGSARVGPPSAPPPPPPPPPPRAHLSGAQKPPPPPPPPLPSASHSGPARVGPPSAPPPPPPPPRANLSGALKPPPPPPPPLISGPKRSVASPPPPPPVSKAPAPPPPPGLGRGAVSGPPPPPGAKCSSAVAPPPPGVKGRASSGLARGRAVIAPKKTVTLHWDKFARPVQGSLWADTQKQENQSRAPEIDISELESLFSAASVDTAANKNAGRRASGVRKPEKVQLVELRRANNCEIMLTKIKIPLSDMIGAVLALDSSALDIDQVENLIKFCPTKEEMEMLRNYTGDKEMLGKCEQFFMELMKVPRIEAKLRVFGFKITFASQVEDLKGNLNTINAATKEVKESAKLRQIMQTILTLGNALNQGTARGSAVGFKLDSLLKLSDTRARNNKMTLMHYLCKLLAEKMPDLLDFAKNLVHLETASKIQLKTLAEEMQAVSKGLEKVEQELLASENDGAISLGFRKVLKNFLDTAEAEVRSLIALYTEVGRNADSLSKYFGEDPARCPFEKVTQILTVFTKTFNKCREENERQAEAEKKKLEKEAMKEKQAAKKDGTDNENKAKLQSQRTMA